jgi:hypothetical protein
LFYTLSSSTGEVVSTSYKLFDAIADVTDEGIIEVNGRVYFHIEYSRSAFLVYNTTTDNFDYKYFIISSSKIFTDMAMLNNDFMLPLLRAIDYSTTYISKNFYSAFFEWNSCNNSTISMTDFDSGDFLIVDRVSTAPTPTPSNFILGGFYPSYIYNTYTPSSTTPQNIYLPSVWNLDHYENNLLPNFKYELEFLWTWHYTSNFYAITYSLVGINWGTSPAWASIDLVNKKVIIDKTPDAAETTKFSFSFQAAFNSEIIIKKIYLTVEPWAVEHCNRCESSSLQWIEWEKNYNLSKDKTKCYNITKTESTVFQSVVAIGIAISLGASALSMSSPQGAFSIINQLNLFILLPMIGAYIPSKVIQILLGMNFAMFSFSFIPIEKTPLVTDLFNFIDYDQSDDYLDLVGLTSGSAILNHIALLLIFAVFGIYRLFHATRLQNNSKRAIGSE